jgi:nucleotide-binding universal stress UspA family protein
MAILDIVAGVDGSDAGRAADVLFGWCNAYTSVDVQRRLVPGDAGQALIDASCGAQLLVVGGRRHGRFVRLLSGSVSRQVSGRAACPVLVVPSGSSTGLG